MIAIQKMKAVRWQNFWGTGNESTRHWWIWIGLFVALWAAEWTWIQALTIAVRPITRHQILIPIVRACFNGVGAVLLVTLIPRFWGLVIVNIGAGISAVGLIAYSQYFKRPLSGMDSVEFLVGSPGRLMSFGVQNIQQFFLAMLLILGAIKIYLLWKARPFTPGWSSRLKGAGLAMVVGIVLVLGLQRTTYSFSQITRQPFSRRIYAYGYLISWSHNAYLRSDSQRFLSQAKADFEKHTDQALINLEEPRKINSALVIVQIESLGFKILDHQVAAGEVVPFLNRLKEKSLLYRIRAFHDHSTADMDFTCMAGGAPSSDIMNYQLAKFEYTNSFPRFLKRLGYQTVAYHGNSGDFFNRRPAFQKMQFDRLGFKEDLGHLKMASSYWGIRDQDLLMRVASEVSQATNRYFAFVITMDSHVPWDLIRPEEAVLFPGSRDLSECYFNSINWVDRVLEQWYEALPEGTTILLYGDHTANLETDKFHSDRTIESEYVPALLHRKGEDWSKTQRNRDASLKTDQLTLLDVMAYVRACLKNGAGESESSE